MNPNRLPKTLHFCIVANRRLFAPRIALRSIPVWRKGLALSTGRVGAERGEPVRLREILRAAARSAVTS